MSRCISPKPGLQSLLEANFTRVLGILGLVLLASLGTAPGLGAETQPEPRVEDSPLPDWVDPLSLDRLVFPQASASSYGYTTALVDNEIRLGPRPVRFCRLVLRVDNSEGLSALGQMNLDFDPGYQTLAIHTLRAWRNGAMVDFQKTATRQILQREDNLEYLMYDGSRTCHLILPDLRVGDILEYAYSIQGANPVLAGNFYHYQSLGYDIPVGRLTLRVLSDKTLFQEIVASELHGPITAEAAGFSFVQTPSGGDFQEYRWTGENLEARTIDEAVPGWENGIPLLQISSMNDWSQVQSWALALFTPFLQPDPEVAAKARQLCDGLTAIQDKIEILTRFVQQEVRYLGLELGAHAYMPHQAGKTLAQRFGDCKDKSLLLAQMLAAVGVDSELVLVNTWKSRFQPRQVPGIETFNHVVLHLPRQGLWIDSTNSNHPATLDTLTWLPWDCGLPIINLDALSQPREAEAPGDPGEDFRHPRFGGFWRAIPRGIPNTLQMEIWETITLPRQPGDSGHLGVNSRYTQGPAEFLRGQLKSVSLDELGRQCQDYYAYLVPDITQEESLIWQEEDHGQLSLVESYELPQPWEEVSNEAGRGSFAFYPMVLVEKLRPPRSNQRQDPWHLEHPLDIQETVVWRVPRFDWELQTNDFNLDNRFFNYSLKFKKLDVDPEDPDLMRLEMAHHLVSKQDHVSPEDMREYRKAVDQVYEQCSWEFSADLAQLADWDPASQASAGGLPGTTNFWRLVLISGLAIGGIAWRAWRRRR